MSGSRRRRGFVVATIFLLGAVAGGYATRDVQPRSLLAVDRCEHCWSPSELAGVLGSVAVQRAPGLLPLRVLETERTVVLRLPDGGRGPEDYVVVPKRDIRDAGHLAAGDEPYLVDAFAVMGKLIRDRHMRDYEILTRGPGAQSVRYLHFHVLNRDRLRSPRPARYR